MFKHGISTLLMLAAACCTAAETARLVADPYGAACHITRKERWIAPKLFPLMKEAGISWVRSDVDWRYWELKPGEFNPQYAPLLDAPLKAGLHFLPILPGDPPKFGKWPWEHLDIYGKFVRHCAEKYARSIQYWEVYNEPDAGSHWCPSAEKYAPLLKRSWQELKAVNPDLKIVYAGIVGANVDWVERTFRKGAHKYFDVMNYHPYTSMPELLFASSRQLRELMTRYGVGDKPIWITEVGWPTTPLLDFYLEVLPVAVREAGLNPAECTVALVCDAKSGFAFGMDNHPRELFPQFKGIRRITLEELKTLNPAECQLLLTHSAEGFPMAYYPAVVQYVKKGGTLVLPYKLPYYFDHQLDGRGGYVLKQVNGEHLKDLHIAWDAWWTREDVPQAESYQRPTPAFRDKIHWDLKDHSKVGRFLSLRNMKEADQFIPLVEGGNSSFNAPLIGVYKLNSDLKGNVIASTASVVYGVSEKLQAQYLPRTFICGFAAGIERIFWYNFINNHANKNYAESHFGLLTNTLGQKPAFKALKQLTRLLPGNSTVPVVETRDDVYLAHWIKPNGAHVWALWSAFNRQDLDTPVTLQIDGKVVAALNHMGARQPIPESDSVVNVTGSILYLVGPQKVSFQLK